jgi:hypothetical protein
MATNNAINSSGSGGGGVSSLQGNAGGALTGALNLITANTNIQFSGSGSIMTLDFLPSSVTQSIFIGNSGATRTTGLQNTGMGELSFSAITSGNGNTGFGFEALHLTDANSDNTAVGVQAFNVSAGAGASSNTGIGYRVGASNGTGTANCLFGFNAGDNQSGGSRNVLIGFQAGHPLSATESDNVFINTGGVGYDVSGVANTLIIGSGTGTGSYNINKAILCGIQGITVTGTAVLISSSDQLGVAVSSKKFKFDIRDAGNSTDQVYKLRPVTFLWDKSSNPGLHDAPTTRQVGLIAEEVALVNRDLVGFDKSGAPLNVQYDRLIPMLLNEIQRLEKRVVALEARSK